MEYQKILNFLDSTTNQNIVNIEQNLDRDK